MLVASQERHLQLGNLLSHSFNLSYQPIFYFRSRNQPLFFYLKQMMNVLKLYRRIFILFQLFYSNLKYHLEYALNLKLYSSGSILNLPKFSIIFFTLMLIFVSPSQLHFSLFVPHESQIIFLASLSLALLVIAIYYFLIYC